MSFIKCEECGKEISDQAEACPSCGAKPAKMGLFKKLLIAFFAIMVIGSLQKACNPPPIKSQEQINADKDRALEQQFDLMRIKGLKEGMKNPASFELVDAIRLDSGMLCITYRATNGFGGIVTESKAINKDAKIVDYSANCNNKSGKDIKYIRYQL